jgi:hypothetical protein
MERASRRRAGRLTDHDPPLLNVMRGVTALKACLYDVGLHNTQPPMVTRVR